MADERTYEADGVAAFLRVRDRFGAFSNMAPGYPLRVCGVDVPSSEALYQALRYPHLPGFQREIIGQPSPILSKRHAYMRVGDTRADWRRVNINIMRYAIRAKAAAHHDRMSALFRETGDMPIVEISNRDPFWGARPDGTWLTGTNALGRLLMELRAELRAQPEDDPVRLVPNFEGAILCGVPLVAEIVSRGPDPQPMLDL